MRFQVGVPSISKYLLEYRVKFTSQAKEKTFSKNLMEVRLRKK